jgi:iron complex outermembrane recepter protein
MRQWKLTLNGCAALRVLAMASSATGIIAPAMAQNAGTKDQPGASDEIIVTGSRIKRAGFDTIQPAIVVGEKLLGQRAITNVADILNQNPAFSSSGTSSVGLSSDSAIGQNFVDFLGIGSQRTLTVVNGMRFPSANAPTPGGSAPGLQVDLNTIPTALIERVETIATGGSPIYGSDAIAGTVNVILKRKFTGFEGSLQSGISSRGDAPKYNAEAVYGFNFDGDKGNIIVSGQYENAKGLRLTDREETARQWFFASPPVGSNSKFKNVIKPDRRIAVENYAGLPLLSRFGYATDGNGVLTPSGGIYQFANDGTLIPYDQGTPSETPINAIGGDGLNLANDTLSSSSERYNATLIANYQLGDRVNLHLEAWYNHSTGRQTERQGESNGVDFQSERDTDVRPVQGPIPLRLDNPFVSDQARRIIRAITGGAPILDVDGDGIADTEGFYLDKQNLDLVRGAPAYTKQDFIHFVGGLNGTLGVGGRDFDWSVSASYGKVTNNSTVRRVLIDRFAQAVDAVRDTNGKVVCRNPSNSCAPLNVLGVGVASPEAIRFVTADSTNRATLSQILVSANIAGSLIRLPGGDLGMSLGTEYRRERSDFRPDLVSSSGVATVAPLTAVGGSISNREIFGELKIPLVSKSMNVPLISTLSVEMAGRYVDSSASGGAFTWTAGGRYAPIPDIQFRGNYTRAVRAPAVTELFLPKSQNQVFAADPCDARFIDSGPNPTVRASNCAAAGIAQPFSSAIFEAGRLVNQSGNLGLKNEIANSWSVGAVARPGFVPGLTVAVDWIDIRLKNAIQLLSADLVLGSCYDSTSYPTAEVCGLFTREPNGQIRTLTTRYQNAGSLKYEGLTADVNYAVPLGSSDTLILTANYLYTKSNQLSVTGTDRSDFAGQIGNSNHRLSGSLAWQHGAYGFFLQGRYFSSAVFDNQDTPTSRDVSRLPGWTVFNTSLSFDLNKGLKLQLSVDNVFDVKAPRYSSASGGSAYSTYYQGLLGRYMSVRATTKF